MGGDHFHGHADLRGFRFVRVGDPAVSEDLASSGDVGEAVCDETASAALSGGKREGFFLQEADDGGLQR